MKEASYHLTLLAQNEAGYRNLLKMASAAYLEGFYFRPRIDKELLEAHHEGLVCLSGCLSSELSRALAAGGERPPPGGRKSPPGSRGCSATATSSRYRTTAWKSSGQ